jgi:hypothetical protein
VPDAREPHPVVTAKQIKREQSVNVQRRDMPIKP